MKYLVPRDIKQKLKTIGTIVFNGRSIIAKNMANEAKNICYINEQTMWIWKKTYLFKLIYEQMWHG